MTEKDLSVACLLWGDWCDGFASQYVWNLFHSVKRNLNLPHRFFLFTDRKPSSWWVYGENAGVIVKELDSPSWLGCLPKYKVHDPSNGLTGRVLVLDLDTIVTGSLDDMASYSGPFITRMTFRGPKLSGGDMLGFEAGSTAWIWDVFNKQTKFVEQITGGRERFLYRDKAKKLNLQYWQEHYPGQILSYKRHVKSRPLPESARLVSCHGNPRPHVLHAQGIPWVREHWNAE